jgi:uncharacterized protein (TIGR00255 family)
VDASTHVTVNYTTVSSRRIVIDQALARQLFLALTDLKRELGLGGQVNLSTLLELREIARVEENEHHVEDLWPAVQEALDSAVANLDAMRLAEGEALGRDILQRIHLIEAWVEQIKSRLPALSSTTGKNWRPASAGVRRCGDRSCTARRSGVLHRTQRRY